MGLITHEYKTTLRGDASFLETNFMVVTLVKARLEFFHRLLDFVICMLVVFNISKIITCGVLTTFKLF